MRLQAGPGPRRTEHTGDNTSAPFAELEEFVVHLLKSYGMDLARVGGPTDDGIDAIGLAPVSDVLADRVAVRIKRYDPEGSWSNIERKDVALFQRDAASKGAERAIFVTFGSFSKRRARQPQIPRRT
jgi:restriction system protein